MIQPPSSTDTSTPLALDVQSLNQLRAQAHKDPHKALKQVAQQFESLFLDMMLKSMRKAVPQNGIMDSEQTKTFTAMLDQQLAQKMSTQNHGLADMIVKQLSPATHPKVSLGRADIK